MNTDMKRNKYGKLSLIMEAYYSIYPEKKGAEEVYCFFDEKQETENWEPFVERIMRTEKCFNEYFQKGGFPEVRDLTDRLRIKVHQEYYKTILHRDPIVVMAGNCCDSAIILWLIFGRL